jgi:endonuclease/exonuclease/phosphatase family metal-dependent hydrolase/MFS family permease
MWSLMVELIPSIYVLSMEGRLSPLSSVIVILFSPSIYHLMLSMYSLIKRVRMTRINSVDSFDETTLYSVDDAKNLENDVEYMKNSVNITCEMTITVISLLRKPFLYVMAVIGVFSNYNFIGQEARVILQGLAVGATWTQLSCGMRDISFDRGRSMSNRRGERQIWSVLLGLLCLIYLRFGYASLNPLFLGNHGWTVTTAVILLCTLFITLIILEELITHFVEIDEPLQIVDEFRHVMEVDPSTLLLDSGAENDEDTTTEEHVRKKFFRVSRFIIVSITRGLSLGSLLFLTHWLFTSSSIIPRWAMLPAYPFNLLIIISLTFGCIVAATSHILKSTIGGILLIASVCVLSFVPNNHSMLSSTFVNLILGGSVMAFVLPSMWIATLDVRSHASSNLSMAITMFISAIVYVFQITVTALFVTITEEPWPIGYHNLQHAFREKPYICMLISAVMIIIGLRTQLIRRPRLRLHNDNTKRTIPTANRRMLILIFVLVLTTFVPSLFVRLLGTSRLADEVPNFNFETFLEKNFKFLTFNVRQGFGMDRRNNFRSIGHLIVKSGAHVIGLQESDTSKIIAGNCDLLEYLSFHTNMYEYYGPSPRESTLGVSVLSAAPIYEAKYYNLPSTLHKSILLELMLEIPLKNETRPIYFLNAYFSSIEYQRDQHEQVARTSKVIQELKRIHNKDIFLVGDLNLAPNSTMLRDIPMVDSVGYITQKHGSYRRPTTKNNSTIDYIFYTLKDEKKTRILNATVLSSGDVSDHFPVYATFEHET